MGFRVIAIPEAENGIDIDLLREKLDGLQEDKCQIRFFYIITVNNPTCTIINTQTVQSLVQIGTQLSRELGRKVPLIIDRAYDNLIHGESRSAPQSGFFFDTLGLVYEIGTLSKILAPSLRIGYH